VINSPRNLHDHSSFRIEEQVNVSFAAEKFKLCIALRPTDLRTLNQQGYIKPLSYPFSQRTGRDSPKPKKGFLLNLSPWLRSVIRPKADSLFVGVDWSQQEIGIAAALSNDQEYIDVYNSPDGDVYLSLTKKSGAIPGTATKETHPQQRKTFKAVQLDLGYGKGVRSLGVDVYEANRDSDGHHLLTLDQAQDRAEEIFDWHKATFSTYWDWIEETVYQARIDGYIRSVDGWTYFVTPTVRDTQLLNFPMQANGAAMMRCAVVNCLQTQQIDLVCTLHDALYINCLVKDQHNTASCLIECMVRACDEILQGKVKVRTDTSIYDHQKGYHDPRGDEILEIMNRYLEENQV
jgi:DNA polymerase-1